MITALPVVIKTLLVFIMVLALTKTRLHLSTCLFAGAVMLGLWVGMAPAELAGSLGFNLVHFDTIKLVLIVALIMVMSRLMKESGQLDRIVSRFTALVRDTRTVGAAMPALIGLLPMPGGALFSAPMVDTAFSGASVSNENKAVVNYWFRHIWEYWWPLYPGVILVVGLLQVEIWHFMLVMLPLTGVSVLAGIIFLLRPMGRSMNIEIFPQGTVRDNGSIWRFIREVMPIIIVVGVIAAVALITMAAGTVGINLKLPGGVAVLPGLAVALVWVAATNQIPRQNLWKVFTDREIVPMVLLVVAIMLFKGVMTDSHAVSYIRTELVSWQFPLILVIMAIPFLAGVVTGIVIGFVGSAFPLVIPLFPAASGVEYLSYACLAYVFGFMGMMLSPVHLCFLVTKDYFSASLLRCYRPLLLPAVSMLAFSWLYFLLLNRF